EILREFVAETDPALSLDVLLRRFVADPREGLAAFVECEPPETRVKRSRGLSDASLSRLAIDVELLARVSAEGAIRLEGAARQESRFVTNLSSRDRRKVRQLHLGGVGAAGEFVGLLIATDLYPQGAPLEQQVE